MPRKIREPFVGVPYSAMLQWGRGSDASEDALAFLGDLSAYSASMGPRQ